MKATLSLHTTSGELGITLVDNQGQKKSQTWDLGRDLGKQLHQILSDFILPFTWQDLQFLAVAKGPGSFTSTRIGVVTARTMAQQLNIPVYGISTLKALAWEYGQNSGATKILVQMKANNEEVFGGIFSIKNKDNISTITEDKLYTLSQWQEVVKEYQEQYEHDCDLVISPDKLGDNSEDVLSLATMEYEREKLHGVFSGWENLYPFYQ